MFCKTSIQSLVYDLVDVLMYPNDEISKIYNKYKIERCFLYQNLELQFFCFYLQNNTYSQ